MEHQPEVLLKAESSPAFLDWAILLFKHKRFIFVTSFVMAILTFIFSILSTPVFEATARVISPQSAGSSSIISQIAAAGAAAGLTASGSLPSGGGLTPDMLNGFIKCTTVENAVIEQMGFVQTWGARRILSKYRSPYTIDHARDELEKNVFRTEVDAASGIVSIVVDYESAQKSAEVANVFVDEVIKHVRQMTSADSSKKKAYYEVEMKKALDSLSRAEDELRKFQDSSGAIQIDAQAKAVLDGIASLEAQISTQEIQLKVMKTYAAPNNPDLKRSEEQLAALRDQRQKLEQKSGGLVSNSIIPTSSIPSLGTEYLRKAREMKFQEALFLTVYKQYEAQRMDETRDLYDIWVVDRAKAPQKVLTPKPLLNTILGGGITFFLCMIWVFFQESLRKRSAQDPRVKKKLAILKQSVFRI